MSNMSDFLENELAQWMFESSAATIFGASDPASLDIRLASATPTDASFTEIAGNGYVLQNVGGGAAGWTTPASPATDPFTVFNASNIDFPAASPSGYTVNGVGVYRVGVSANWLFQAAASKVLNAGDILRIPAGILSPPTGLHVTLA
jgi:hypothetical protein